MSLEKEMTIIIDPGREECFYQPIKLGQVIDLEYQVSTFHLYLYIFHYILRILLLYYVIYQSVPNLHTNVVTYLLLLSLSLLVLPLYQDYPIKYI
jgi:hypothetical protein